MAVDRDIQAVVAAALDVQYDRARDDQHGAEKSFAVLFALVLSMPEHHSTVASVLSEGPSGPSAARPGPQEG